MDKENVFTIVIGGQGVEFAGSFKFEARFLDIYS
jgi:hypothetical protein